MIGKDDLALYKITDNVDEAVRECRHFYSNYHSLRYNKGDAIFRLQAGARASSSWRRSTPSSTTSTRSAASASAAALPAERDEPSLARLPRLVFNFNKRDHGRLRMLINRLNDLPA